MKKGIHPEFYTDAQVVCASCGATWTTGSTQKSIRTEVCSNCHPFYTGQLQRILDVEGQVDRFYKRLQARQQFSDDEKARIDAKISPERPLEELRITSRALDALTKAGLKNVGHVLDRLAEGEQAMLAIDGFGRKSLIDLKKHLRQLGYKMPEKAEEIVV